MAKFGNYNIEDMNMVCNLGRALSSPVRLEMLQLLYENNMIIGDIAKKLNIPASSAAFHLKILEEAGLIRMEVQPGTRGNMKLCARKVDHVIIDMIQKNSKVNETFIVEMPVGAYTRCSVTPTCGLRSAEGVIGNEDIEYFFYLPERFKAGMLWSSSGYVEYSFPNGIPKNKMAKKFSISMEICSEAPGYREDWKSDITLWVNSVECGTVTIPGDFGERRGRLTPLSVENGCSQYGLQTVWEIGTDGSAVNGEKVSNVSAIDVMAEKMNYIEIRIGNKEDAAYIGGFNIFGKSFGDYNQDIVLNIEY
jgi:predicted transcriptional regulator